MLSEDTCFLSGSWRSVALDNSTAAGLQTLPKPCSTAELMASGLRFPLLCSPRCHWQAAAGCSTTRTEPRMARECLRESSHADRRKMPSVNFECISLSSHSVVEQHLVESRFPQAGSGSCSWETLRYVTS